VLYKPDVVVVSADTVNTFKNRLDDFCLLKK